MSQKQQIIQEVITQFEPYLSPNDAGFIHRVFDKGLSIYAQRLAQIGFNRKTRVLDAGCGFGQWSLALAESNTAVVGVDIATERLLFLQELVDQLSISNLSVARSDELWNTSFEDESFDAIFCYGVLFLTPWRETLREFARLLQPGGSLYVNANGLGWYKHLWYTGHNAIRDYDPQCIAAQTWLDTLNYQREGQVRPGSQLLIEPQALIAKLQQHGFRNIQQGSEGVLTVAGFDGQSTTFFNGEYFGDVGVYEVLATR